MSLSRKLQGTARIVRELPGQRRVQYLPREALEALRDARAREIVQFAAATVPHYRELFRREGIDPREIDTTDQLARLPLLTKEELQAAPERFVSERVRRVASLMLSTTGTTGVPVSIIHDRASLLANIAYAERERVVEARLAGSRRYSILQITREGATPRKIRAFYDRNAFRPGRPLHEPLSVAEPFERIIEAIERIRPDVVWSYAAFLETFFRTIGERDRLGHVPKVIVYGGGGMSDEGRALLEERFGVAVLSQYAAIEALKIAFLCEERRGFHLHEDLADVRLLDASGAPAAPGESGEVVLSNLVNRGTVLLNYRLGDMATAQSDPCPCGRTSAVLADVDGRVDEIVVLPSGELVLTVQVWDAVAGHPEIVRWQLVQLAADRFQLRAVGAIPGAVAAGRVAIAASLRSSLPGASVDIVEVTEIPLRGGKFRPIVPLETESGA